MVNINLVERNVRIAIRFVVIVLVQQYVPSVYQDMFSKILFVKILVIPATMLTSQTKIVFLVDQDVILVSMEIVVFHPLIIVWMVSTYKIVCAINVLALVPNAHQGQIAIDAILIISLATICVYRCFPHQSSHSVDSWSLTQL